jgi:hypothetical protein
MLNYSTQSAQVFASAEDPAFSVMVSGRRPSGTIAAGDFLSLGFVTAGVAVNSAVANQNLINLEQTITAKKMELDALLQKYTPQFPAVLAAEKQLRTLEERRSAMELEQAAAAPATIRSDTHATVRPDGMISVPFAGEIRAAGLTPAELDAALARALSGTPVQQTPHVRILPLVTVLVPLGASEDEYHVFVAVKTPRQKIVQTFAGDIRGAPTLARVIPLAAGSYHLTVAVKNLTTGATHSSELDFTVD